MRKFIGTEVNNWIVVNSPKRGYYTIKCKTCGKEKLACGTNVIKGYLKPCDCDENVVKEYYDNKARNYKHIGENISGYTVIDKVQINKNYSHYTIKCDSCGETREVAGTTIAKGFIKPCNCRYKCYARTEKQKEVVGLFQKGYTIADISRALNRSPQSVSCSLNWTMKHYNTFKYNKQ